MIEQALQIGAVIVIGVLAVFSIWFRWCDVRDEKRKREAQLGPLGQPSCPVCGEPLTIANLYDTTMPHVCRPEK